MNTNEMEKIKKDYCEASKNLIDERNNYLDNIIRNNAMKMSCERFIKANDLLVEALKKSGVSRSSDREDIKNNLPNSRNAIHIAQNIFDFTLRK